MINGKKVLALIPARGGSKGVPRKALVDFAGMPLMAWTIEAAKKSKYIDRLILSTDDEEYASLAKSLGCDVPFIREGSLATDSASGMDVVLDAIGKVAGYDLVLLLQPTSPLRGVDDIDACLEFSQKKGSDYCLSVVAVEKSPYWMFTAKDEKLEPLLDSSHLEQGRQDLPKVYMPNGALYIAPISQLRETPSFFTDRTLAYIMSKERSVDIDSPEDLLLAQYFLENH